MTRRTRGKRLVKGRCYYVTGALGERHGDTWRLKTRRLYERLRVVSWWNG